jgi:hypothetical protein
MQTTERSGAGRNFQASTLARVASSLARATCAFPACLPSREPSSMKRNVVSRQSCRRTLSAFAFRVLRIQELHKGTSRCSIWMIIDQMHRLDHTNASTGDHRCDPPNLMSSTKHAGGLVYQTLVQPRDSIGIWPG